MKQIIKIADLYGSEVRTRSVMERFGLTLSKENEYLLDMSGVELISRSAADELYNILHSDIRVEVINLTQFVQRMMDAVTLGRFQPRDLPTEQSDIINCPDMESLHRFLSA